MWPDTDADAYRGLLPALYFRQRSGGWAEGERGRGASRDGMRCVDHGREPDKVVIADMPD